MARVSNTSPRKAKTCRTLKNSKVISLMVKLFAVNGTASLLGCESVSHFALLSGFITMVPSGSSDALLAAVFGLVLALRATALPAYLQAGNAATEGRYLSQDVHWLSQRVDHFTLQDRRQFQQRYYEFVDYFRSPDGPIFLRICGESTCGGISNDYNGVLAEEFGAALVTLEHRYYGESSPFTELTTDNLKYLSTNQALFDLATFRNSYQDQVNKRYNKTGDNPWFVFGISYSGALSAWFRLKFPHLTRGSLASSGVVLAVFNYSAFDEQVAESAGPACASVLRAVNYLVDEGLEKNATAVKLLFKAEQLTVDGDFLYLLADAAAIAIQYGHPEALCDPLVAASASGEDILEAFAKYVKSFYYDYYGVKPITYSQEYLKRTEAGPESGERQWWYQVCTEVAYFQVAPSNNSIRSSGVDTKYHLDLCSNVFGDGTYPEVDITNLYYGGTDIAGSRIFFTNGSQDPWRHASKQKSSPGEPAYVIQCHNCGHGSDLRGCPQSPLQLKGDSSKCTKPEEVNHVRELISIYIKNWLRFGESDVLSTWVDSS